MNAILLPSGDHVGQLSPYPGGSSFLGLLPSAFISQIPSPAPLTCGPDHDWKAIWLPSGDQTGKLLCPDRECVVVASAPPPASNPTPSAAAAIRPGRTRSPPDTTLLRDLPSICAPSFGSPASAHG